MLHESISSNDFSNHSLIQSRYQQSWIITTALELPFACLKIKPDNITKCSNETAIVEQNKNL